MENEIIVIIIGVLIFGAVVFLSSNNKKRALHVMTGWGLYEAYNFILDFLIWPVIQGIFGYLGIIILIFFVLINNFIVLRWYHKKKVDWLGVGEVEDLKVKGHLWVNEVSNHENFFKRVSLYIPAKMLQLVIWLFNKNDIFAFVTLSTWQDSFVTTIFLRHGNFDKLDRRDYIIFVSSTIFSCLVWSFLMQIIITAVKSIVGLF